MSSKKAVSLFREGPSLWVVFRIPYGLSAISVKKIMHAWPEEKNAV
jgi:hypothetical protein